MDTQSILRAAFFTPGVYGRWGLPLLFEGKPGTGKSATIYETAKALGFQTETLLASLRDPTDFGGMPVITDKGEFRLASMPWVKRVVEARHSVVFLDEINTAPESVFAALLRVVLEGVVGDETLPSTVRFVAAQNSVADSAGGRELSPALANRFGHLPFNAPDASSWADWLLATSSSQTKSIKAETEEARVMELWPQKYAVSRGLVAGFVRARPSLIHKMPEMDTHKAWPSPRTWEMACRAHASADIQCLSQVEQEVLVEAFVGSAAASEFFAYAAQLDLPNPIDLLEGRVTLEHDVKRLDRTAAILNACLAVASSKNAPAEHVNALWRMLGLVGERSPDIIVHTATSLLKAKGLKSPDSRPVLKQLQPVLQAAGIDAGAL